MVESADEKNYNYDDGYNAAISGLARYFFDRTGFHDVDPVKGFIDSIFEILNAIRSRGRVTPTNVRVAYTGTQPDYSWNWHDVHFAQMNLFPNKTNSGLDWLQKDLETNVGRSGNPLVMIHNYSFSKCSRQWWSDKDRENYWNHYHQKK